MVFYLGAALCLLEPVTHDSSLIYNNVSNSSQVNRLEQDLS